MTDGGSGPRIRTPDQRLRVFVSSTLKELEPERRAARAAIERLKLAPVMFELGARPHPPRQLYRAYLEQSDVFVALYWQEYGWVAPGEEISGLEDEYRLAPREMPKLIYLKQPAEREARLADLVARVRDDDTASYTPFSTVEELAELVATDLATLLAERFDASHAASEPTSPSPADCIWHLSGLLRPVAIASRYSSKISGNGGPSRSVKRTFAHGSRRENNQA